jgi:hypothetical protein
VSIIGLIFLIALGILLYSLLNNGSQQASRTRDQAAQINAQNTQVAAMATAEQLRMNQLQQTQEALAKITPSVTATLPGAAATSVLAIPTATSLPTATVSADSATKTASAKATSSVGSKGYPGAGTPIVGPTTGAGTPQATSTALPSTGFADDVGLPGMLGLAAVLIVVIFLARRARTH